MLIDGNSLTYRAFFALPTDMATASGQVTNAVFGFTSMLINLLRDHPPRRRWRWPSTGPSRRSATSGSTTYKANRSAAPDILRQQMGLVRQVIDTLEIPIARAGRRRGRRHHRHARHPGPRRRATTSSSSPATATATSWSRTRPSRSSTTAAACPTTRSTTRPASRSAPASTRPATSQYAALRGDPSDNLPGVPGRRREDGGQAHQQVRRARRHLRAPRRADARSSARTSPSTRRRSARTPR